MESNDRICPYCTNGTTLMKKDILDYGNKRLYVRKDKVYYEDNAKKVLLRNFYFCPFCGREFAGKRLGNRKFRGE